MNCCSLSSLLLGIMQLFLKSPFSSVYCRNFLRMKSLLVGVRTTGSENNPTYTIPSDVLTLSEKEKVLKHISVGKKFDVGSSLCFTNQDIENYNTLVVFGYGDGKNDFKESEDINLNRENIRSGVAAGIKQLLTREITDEVHVDDCGDAQSAAEGAILGHYRFEIFKSKKYKIPTLSISSLPSSNKKMWDKGVILANYQNLARTLKEYPSNWMTPRHFAKTIEAESIKVDNSQLSIVTRDRQWIEKEKMGAFLSVAQGSTEDPVFLEMHYKAAGNSAPIVFVGKGITFDTGGISIKPSNKMDEMRGDMGGAACVAATILAIAHLNLPVNVIGLIPLCENMPSGNAIKPGDVVYARNQKSIQINNTDAEGRLILADALDYAHTFNPRTLIDVATLTGAIGVALGGIVTGTFSNSNKLWNQLYKSGVESGDRLWRMPLYKHYQKQVTNSVLADCLNVSKTPGGGSCTAAAFLSEFVSVKNWAHLDIGGTMMHSNEIPYLPKGMSGRPTRTLIEFVENFCLKE